MTAMVFLAESTSDQVPTDWDLYMVHLVNQVRTDAAGENALHGTDHSATAVAPLTYLPLVGREAQNHNEWMVTNQNSPAINDPTNTSPVSDSFTHYETLNSKFGGPPGNGSTTS